VTTHDGRPTKIEGNPDHPLSRGATCAVGQASVLSLYDSQRLKQPVKHGKAATWADVDRDINARLSEIRQRGGSVRLLTATVNSPTLSKVIAEFLGSFSNARHVVYDPISVSAILDAHQTTHGVRALPHYRFDRATAIVSLDADFLGTWISPVEFTRAYSGRRRVTDGQPVTRYHAQVESRLSLTGSKADRRVCIRPGALGAVATHLTARLAERAGAPVTWALPTLPIEPATLNDLVEHLWESRGAGLVVSGSQDVRVQVLVNTANHFLGAYESTIDAQPSYQRQGSDTDLAALRGELSRGDVAALIIAGVNPVYDLPDGSALLADLRKVGLVVAVADRDDETAAAAHFVCPDHHFLESWGDAEPVSGVISLIQPTIQPLNRTRAFMESLAAWTGKPATAYDLLRSHWETAILPRAGSTDAFAAFWDKAVERGVVDGAATSTPGETSAPRTFSAFNASASPVSFEPGDANGLTVVVHPNVGLMDGRHAHNPWLQELPDPITKVTWDNYAALSPATAQRLGIAYGDVVRVVSSGAALELPAIVQPGQDDDVVAIPLGYGRKGTERFTTIGPQWLSARAASGLVGCNAAVFITSTDGRRQYAGARAMVTRTGVSRRLASTQFHHSLTVPGALTAASAQSPGIIQEISAGHSSARAGAEERREDLWPSDHQYKGHRWGMVIDLDSCTGCSACVVACQSENNIPVVGQDEIVRQREMHWLRIDRYYAGDAHAVEVAFQPMLCQQCEQAPCETVCPVLATVHSSEGLNEQVYNRCVGTRYCANNCPYKVRRFNWFDYQHDSFESLALNPNVTVRARGVMEKCTFCVQRIEEAKIEARRLGSAVADGAIQTACQQTCPAQAIVFGDLNDPKSRVAQLADSHRTYRALEELNTRPAVRYLQIVRAHTEEPSR
jgi:molybdopterin-containing oxidoreductase family iron-sulfur binding subunit